MTAINRQFRSEGAPTGRVGQQNFDLVEEPVPEIGDGEALVRTCWISLDPTNRVWMTDTPGYLPPVAIGEVMRGAGVGQVVASRNDALPRGLVRHGPDRLAGLRRHERLVSAPARARRAAACSPSAALGVLGITGADGVLRDGRHRQAAARRDRRRVRGGRRRRHRRGSDREDPRRAHRRASPAGRRSAPGSSTRSATTRPSTTRRRTGASSSRRRHPTGSTSTSRTSAARSWTPSSRA